MLKHDIKIYFREFTKILSICFQLNTTHRLGNVQIFLTWIVKCLCQIWNSFRWIYSFYWLKFIKYIKLLIVQGNGCYDINVTFISSPKNGLLEFVKFEIMQVSSFFYIWKKNHKVFGKNTVAFRHNLAYMVNSFVFYYIWQLWL